MDGLVVFGKGKSLGCTTASCRFYSKYEDASDFYNKLSHGRNAQLYSRVPFYEIDGWVLVKERGVGK